MSFVNRDDYAAASPSPAGGQNRRESASSSASLDNAFYSSHSRSFSPIPFSLNVSQLPLAPSPQGHNSRARDSDSTLAEANSYGRYSFSSYRHPFDITPPQLAHGEIDRNLDNMSSEKPQLYRRSVSFADKPTIQDFEPFGASELFDPDIEREQKRRGIPSQMLELQRLDDHLYENSDSTPPSYSAHRRPLKRFDSAFSNTSEVLDPDDPRVTGTRAEHLEDPEDVEKNILRQMDYRTRRKHLMRVKIEYNVTCKTSNPHTTRYCLNILFSHGKSSRIFTEASPRSYVFWSSLSQN